VAEQVAHNNLLIMQYFHILSGIKPTHCRVAGSRILAGKGLSKSGSDNVSCPALDVDL